MASSAPAGGPSASSLRHQAGPTRHEARSSQSRAIKHLRVHLEDAGGTRTLALWPAANRGPLCPRCPCPGGQGIPVTVAPLPGRLRRVGLQAAGGGGAGPRSGDHERLPGGLVSWGSTSCGCPALLPSMLLRVWVCLPAARARTLPSTTMRCVMMAVARLERRRAAAFHRPELPADQAVMPRPSAACLALPSRAASPQAAAQLLLLLLIPHGPNPHRRAAPRSSSRAGPAAAAAGRRRRGVARGTSAGRACCTWGRRARSSASWLARARALSLPAKRAAASAACVVRFTVGRAAHAAQAHRHPCPVYIVPPAALHPLPVFVVQIHMPPWLRQVHKLLYAAPTMTHACPQRLTFSRALPGDCRFCC